MSLQGAWNNNQQSSGWQGGWAEPDEARPKGKGWCKRDKKGKGDHCEHRGRLEFKAHFVNKTLRPYPDEKEKSFINSYVGIGTSSHRVDASKFLSKSNLKVHLTSANTELRKRPEYGITEASA